MVMKTRICHDEAKITFISLLWSHCSIVCTCTLDGQVQALLDEWRVELARKPLSMSEAEACKVLGLALSEDGRPPEEELKAAYRRLARK